MDKLKREVKDCIAAKTFRETMLGSSNLASDQADLYTIEEKYAVLGKSSLKHSKSFRFLLSNQETARQLTSV